MPRGDGTGPPGGSGPGSGRGLGRGGTGQGRMKGNRAGAGSGGKCVCPNCGEVRTHQRGIPCLNNKCPKCGTMMVRG